MLFAVSDTVADNERPDGPSITHDGLAKEEIRTREASETICVARVIVAAVLAKASKAVSGQGVLRRPPLMGGLEEEISFIDGSTRPVMDMHGDSPVSSPLGTMLYRRRRANASVAHQTTNPAHDSKAACSSSVGQGRPSQVAEGGDISNQSQDMQDKSDLNGVNKGDIWNRQDSAVSTQMASSRQGSSCSESAAEDCLDMYPSTFDKNECLSVGSPLGSMLYRRRRARAPPTIMANTIRKLSKSQSDKIHIVPYKCAGISTVGAPVSDAACILKSGGLSQLALDAITSSLGKDAGAFDDSPVESMLRPARCKFASPRGTPGEMTCKELRQAGYGAKQLREGDFNVTEMREAGFSPEQLKSAGFSGRELLYAGFAVKELRDEGIDCQDEQGTIAAIETTTSTDHLATSGGLDQETLDALAVTSAQSDEEGDCVDDGLCIVRRARAYLAQVAPDKRPNGQDVFEAGARTGGLSQDMLDAQCVFEKEDPLARLQHSASPSVVDAARDLFGETSELDEETLDSQLLHSRRVRSFMKQKLAQGSAVPRNISPSSSTLPTLSGVQQLELDDLCVMESEDAAVTRDDILSPKAAPHKLQREARSPVSPKCGGA